MSEQQLEIEIVGECPFEHDELYAYVAIALSSTGVSSGHLAIEFVDADRIAELNREFRGKDQPTDVLSFPIDGCDNEIVGMRELGDIIICLEHTVEPLRAVVHGALHLVGMDHEEDKGQMLAVEEQIMAWMSRRTRIGDSPASPQAN